MDIQDIIVFSSLILDFKVKIKSWWLQCFPWFEFEMFYSMLMQNIRPSRIYFLALHVTVQEIWAYWVEWGVRAGGVAGMNCGLGVTKGNSSSKLKGGD